MNDVGSPDLQRISIAHKRAPWFERRYNPTLVVLVTTLLLTASALSRSLFDGRLAAPITHDDVNYFIEGIQRLTILRTGGFFALISDFFQGSLHAPLSTYQAMLAYLIFGTEDWAPYATNVLYVVVFLGFAAWLVRDCPAIVIAAVLACLIALPIASNTITEFAPERVCSLVTAIGVILMLRLPLFDAPFASRFRAGLCLGIAFLAHPVASPFTMIALMATLGVIFLRDMGWRWEFKKLKIGMVNSILNIGLSVWLPALYIVPRRHEYLVYFYDALTNPTWIGENRPFDPLFYLTGAGGEFMFGHKLWAYSGIICLGMIATWWRGDWQSLARQAQLALLTLVFWLVPTLAPAKDRLFGLTFGFSVAFMTAVALASIYRAAPSARGATIVSVIGFSLFAFYQPTQLFIWNTPQSVPERAFTWQAIDRIKAILLGNAVDPHGIKVYTTNIGAYAPNILQYYLLKMDPTLDWEFQPSGSLAYDSNAEHHIDFIRGSKGDYPSTQDFVIAGERYNGLTYQPQAAPAEDTLYAALWRDPGFVALDRFYGPGGREVTIFARKGSFAGWHPVSMAPTTIRKVIPSWLPGNVEQTLLRWDRKDDQRYAVGGLMYLQTFAARPIAADLEIEWVGEALGQKLTIVINQQKVVELTYSAEGKFSSLRQQIDLSRGTNDIVLKSDGPLKLNRLLIVPNIASKSPDHVISVATATYGGNCKAPRGNATQDVAESCDGKNDCTYKVQLPRLGEDPAQSCAKDFAVSYFCSPERTTRYTKISGPSDGRTVSLSCSSEISGSQAVDLHVNSSPDRPDSVTKVTNISELPPLRQSSSAPNAWDLVEGLSVEVVQGSAVVSGQHILRLVAAGTNGRHALSARFREPASAKSELSDAGLREILAHLAEPSGIYRAVAWIKARFGRLFSKRIYHTVAWVKAEPGVRVMIEARDSVDPHAGNPSNYGVAKFDLSARSVVDSTGNILASGVEAAADDWVKLWVNLRSRDGQLFALIGLLEGRDNRKVFEAAGQSVIFGGFEISHRQ